ncbi:MAG TPA: phage holin family protein [Verrucomicrobiales bacterium]|nr:phage holin family protein [Verrucomicrobiales bacterium]
MMHPVAQETCRKSEPKVSGKREIPSLVSDLVEEAGQWAEQEVEIVRTELQEKGTEAASAIKHFAIGLITAGTACVFFLTALALAAGSTLLLTGLTPAVAYPLGFFLFSLVAAIIASVLLTKSKRNLSLSHLTPHRSIQSLRDSLEWVESKLRP